MTDGILRVLYVSNDALAPFSDFDAELGQRMHGTDVRVTYAESARDAVRQAVHIEKPDLIVINPEQGSSLGMLSLLRQVEAYRDAPALLTMPLPTAEDKDHAERANAMLTRTPYFSQEVADAVVSLLVQRGLMPQRPDIAGARPAPPPTDRPR